MVRIAVLGCGRIGRLHAANIAAHPRAKLATVFDLHIQSAQEVVTEHGVSLALSAEEIFASNEVDAVLISTATETHANYIEAAVAAGKPVLCEKPIDLSLERVNRCAETVAGTKVPIQLGFNRRFDPSHRAVRDAMRAGKIGDLHQVIISSRDPDLPPSCYLVSSCGLFSDMTFHVFELALFMVEEYPV